MKRCAACKRELSEALFYKDRRASDGLHSACKPCHIKRCADWDRRNPRDRTAYNAAYFQQNKERLRPYRREQRKQWRRGNATRLAWEADYRKRTSR